MSQDFLTVTLNDIKDNWTIQDYYDYKITQEIKNIIKNASSQRIN
jgi:hypothetical protein